jgi:hypothetical protein
MNSTEEEIEKLDHHRKSPLETSLQASPPQAPAFAGGDALSIVIIIMLEFTKNNIYTDRYKRKCNKQMIHREVKETSRESIGRKRIDGFKEVDSIKKSVYHILYNGLTH